MLNTDPHRRLQFSTHAALQYLHIGTGTPEIVADALGDALFTVQPGTGDCMPPLLPALELLGFNSGMRWVAPRPATQKATATATAYAEFWPKTKTYFRTVEDFHGCADWEWLLRHHGQDDDDCDICECLQVIF